MVSGATVGKAISSGVLTGLQFVPEQSRSFAPAGAGKAQELSGDKVPRMGSHEIEELGFGPRVAEGFERIDLRWRKIHREKMTAVISRSSRTRRRREKSSHRA